MPDEQESSWLNKMGDVLGITGSAPSSPSEDEPVFDGAAGVIESEPSPAEGEGSWWDKAADAAEDAYEWATGEEKESEYGEAQTHVGSDLDEGEEVVPTDDEEVSGNITTGGTAGQSAAGETEEKSWWDEATEAVEEADEWATGDDEDEDEHSEYENVLKAEYGHEEEEGEEVSATDEGESEETHAGSYNETAWDEMSEAERQAWGVLGWDEDNWENGPAPPSASKKWDDLTDAERAAATALNYKPSSWDGEEGIPDNGWFNIEGDNPELVIELWPYEAAVAGGGAISTDPKLGDRDLGEAAAPLEELSGKRQTCDAGVDRIIEEHSAEEAGESTGGLLDGDWNVMDGLQQALDVVGQGIEDVAKLPDELEAAAKDVGVDLLMFGAEQVVEQRGLIEQAMQGVQGVLDSDGVKMLGIANPAFEISRTIGLNLARAGEATPEIAQQLVDNEQGIRALTEMNQRETTELALQQIDVGETYETEFHGGAEIHAELGVKAGAQAESKMTKVTENEFQLELTVGGKLQVGVGASAQGEGAAADVGGGIGGKVVVDVKGKTPEEARAQVATLIQLANGDPADLEQIAQLKGVTVSEAEGKIAAILSGDLTPLSVELRGDVVPEYRVIGDESHVGMGAAITIKAEAGGPVNIAVPDNVASLAESPDAQSLDPRARALLGDLPMDVVEEIEDLYGLGGGLKLGAEVQVEANLYAPIDAGVELATSGGLAKHANRLEITLKGKIEAGNSNVEITHQVVVKDLQGLSEAAGMGAEQLAVAMQDGAVTPEELSKLIPNQQDLDQYVDFNSKAEIGHFDGIKIDVLGFGGRMGESNKLTLYEVQDGKMVRKVDDLKSALDQMEANTQFGLFPES